jgi:sigma-E factor negative regulatory protein RseA
MVVPLKPNHEEALSAWLDDAPIADKDAADWARHALDSDASGRTLSTYVAIGNAMRQPQGGSLGSPADVDRFWAQLAQGLEAPPHALPSVSLPPEPPMVAANDSAFKWRAFGSFAVMAVGLSVWLAIGSPPADLTRQTVALQTPDFVPVVTANASVARDPDLDAFLAAHRQRGSASALQGPVGFIRNVAWQAGSP